MYFESFVSAPLQLCYRRLVPYQLVINRCSAPVCDAAGFREFLFFLVCAHIESANAGGYQRTLLLPRTHTLLKPFTLCAKIPMILRDLRRGWPQFYKSQYNDTTPPWLQ
jgi:hypothetical protein